MRWAPKCDGEHVALTRAWLAACGGFLGRLEKLDLNEQLGESSGPHQSHIHVVAHAHPG